MPKRQRPATPFESGYRLFGLVTKKQLTIEDVRKNLPSWIELWDGRDGTKPIRIKDTKDGFYTIKVVARLSRSIPLTDEQLAALLGT